MMLTNLFKVKKKYSEVKKLLQAVILGDLKNAEKILSKNPEVLLERGTVKDYSNRTHANRTAYQLALGAADFNVKDAKGNIVVDGMVEMIEKYFSKLPRKTLEEINKIIHDQYAEQFPEGYEITEEKRAVNDSAALHRIINVITEAKNDEVRAASVVEDKIHKIVRKEKSERADELQKIVQSVIKANSDEDFEKAFKRLSSTLIKYQLIKGNAFNFDLLKAVYQFRNYLEPKASLTFGKHFNYSLLEEAAQLYDQNYALFGNDLTAPKIEFYWQKVFGYIERFVPANGAQSIAQGLLYILERGHTSNRSFDFGSTVGKYFPLGLDLDWEIGYTQGCSAMGESDSSMTQGSYTLFKKFCQAKTTMQQPMQYADSQSCEHWCSIL